ncbi:unnamed protein product [Schistosoma turkestanicum]|nr:unnamed protein product [Schistosoma turkestanicum]
MDSQNGETREDNYDSTELEIENTENKSDRISVNENITVEPQNLDAENNSPEDNVAKEEIENTEKKSDRISVNENITVEHQNLDAENNSPEDNVAKEEIENTEKKSDRISVNENITVEHQNLDAENNSPEDNVAKEEISGVPHISVSETNEIDVGHEELLNSPANENPPQVISEEGENLASEPQENIIQTEEPPEVDERLHNVSKSEEADGLIPSSAETGAIDNEECVTSEAKVEEDTRRREELIEKYKQSLNEQKAVRELNFQLQTKLAEYFRRKKGEAADQQGTQLSTSGRVGDATTDYELKYNKYISSLFDLRHQSKIMEADYTEQIDKLKQLCQTKQEEVDKAYQDFNDFRYNIGKRAINSRTRKPLSSKELSSMFTTEKYKEETVREVRLENIKLKNKLLKAEAQLKSKDQLSEGLNLIDFEQLKFENQTFDQKIEERSEEMIKLRRKISKTVQIITHLKEKLQFVLDDNASQRKILEEIDADVSMKKDHLTKIKQTREHLRGENTKLRRSCGLLGRNALLLNYEDSFDSVMNKRQSLNEIKRTTANYRLQARALAQKIKNLQNKKEAF